MNLCGQPFPIPLDWVFFCGSSLFGHHILSETTQDLKVGRFRHVDAGQMYLNYAHEHWTLPGEFPPVGLILAVSKGGAEAHYALEGLSNQVLAADYLTALPNELIFAE